MSIVLTVRWSKLFMILAAPAFGVDINAVWSTPVVIPACPAVKVDQQLTVLDVGNGGHSCEGRVEPVLRFQPHSNQELVRSVFT